MQTIILETRIAAPIERCFLLSCSIDLHMQSTAQTGERAIAGTTHGIIGPNETVTWRGRHFGFMLTHETLISKYERPQYFQDVMLRGMFKSFVHDHYFEEVADTATLMRDELRFAAPLGFLGKLVEPFLKKYLAAFLRTRNIVIREVAETERWKNLLQASIASNEEHV